MPNLPYSNKIKEETKFICRMGSFQPSSAQTLSDGYWRVLNCKQI